MLDGPNGLDDLEDLDELDGLNELDGPQAMTDWTAWRSSFARAPGGARWRGGRAMRDAVSISNRAKSITAQGKKEAGRSKEGGRTD